MLLEMASKKNQSSGDGSLNIQAETLNISAGLSVRDVRDIALELFESNFQKLAGVARSVAEQRAIEITDRFIDKLSKSNPSSIAAAKDPDFQYAIFHAQKAYARTGGSKLGDILVDLLVDRAGKKDREIIQLVLNEAISVAPKLSDPQMDILACRFNLAYCSNPSVIDLKSLANHIRTNILVFSGKIAVSKSNYDYLNYAGCSKTLTQGPNAVQILKSTYPNLFTRGFSKDHISHLKREDPRIEALIMPCHHSPDGVQAKGLNNNQVYELGHKLGIPQSLVSKVVVLNQNDVLDEYHSKLFLVSICPELERFFDEAGRLGFQQMGLTSIGIAVAHAHSRITTGFSADLSVWLGES